MKWGGVSKTRLVLSTFQGGENSCRAEWGWVGQAGQEFLRSLKLKSLVQRFKKKITN